MRSVKMCCMMFSQSNKKVMNLVFLLPVVTSKTKTIKEKFIISKKEISSQYKLETVQD